MYPKRHHFVPELLLKRFTDRDNRLYFFDHHRPELGVRRSTPKQLFNESHLYTEVEKDGGKNTSLERAFAALESRVEPVIERSVEAARRSQTPRLSRTEKAIWDQFLLVQWKRVPDLHSSIPTLRGVEEEVDRLLGELGELVPHRRREIDALREPDTKRIFMHNIKVRSHAIPSTNVLSVLAQRGLAAMRITRPEKCFVIGSFPVVKLTSPGRTSLLDPAVEVWLPVASDVALGIGLHSGDEVFVPISDPTMIRYFNQTVVRQSTMFAGRSEALVRSLGRSGWKQATVGIIPNESTPLPS